jgi:hypothetical protein
LQPSVPLTAVLKSTVLALSLSQLMMVAVKIKSKLLVIFKMRRKP